MELRHYWAIIKRRIWIPIAVVLLILISYGFTYRPPQPQFVAHMRFVVGVKPEPNPLQHYTYDRYYTWLTAEYLVDDLSEVVKSYAFARDVASLSGLAVQPGVIQGSTSAGKLHRILDITIIWNDPKELLQIADAVVETLETRGATYFGHLSTENATIALIDPPAISPVAPSLRQKLDLPLRLILGTLAALGLIFILDYLDDSVRDVADAQSLGIPIVGQVPARRRWWRVFRRLPNP